MGSVGKENLMKNHLRNILFIRTDRIGDVILTTPAATILKEYYPDTRITFLGRSYTAPLLKIHRDIDGVITYLPGGTHRGPVGHFRLAKQLRAKHFDAAIFFYPRPALAATARLAGIPLTIGVGYRWYSLLFKKRIFEHRKHGMKHELEHNLSLLAPLVPNLPGKIRFNFQIPPEVIDATHRKLSELGVKKPFAIIHPGNGGSAPNLTPEQYAAIAHYILESTSMNLLFTGTLEERTLIEMIRRELKNKRAINGGGAFSIVELMAVISEAGLFISSSTGPLHLANAMNTPLIGFYCPARSCSPRRWGPYHQPEWVLTPDVKPCDDCNIARCPNGNCLATISESGLIHFVARRLENLANRSNASGIRSL